MPDEGDKLQGESGILFYSQDKAGVSCDNGNAPPQETVFIYPPQHTRFILFFPEAETANTTSTLFPQMLQR
jgi:hypothetical protein